MNLGIEHNLGQDTKQEAPHSIELSKELEQTDDDELIREKLGMMLQSIEDDLGIKFISNVNELYDNMRSDNCLVRTDRLSRVLETMESESPLKISDEDERHYANAVIPNQEGIRIALSEGQAPGPVRIMVGFGKTIIGFKADADNISVSEIEFGESEIRDPLERRYVTRHVTGELSKSDIKYIVMRIPFPLVKDEYLTEQERHRKPTFVFRGAKL
jgi:hypothetical protein